MLLADRNHRAARARGSQREKLRLPTRAKRLVGYQSVHTGHNGYDTDRGERSLCLRGWSLLGTSAYGAKPLSPPSPHADSFYDYCRQYL